ncbi:MAG: hypothetical protein ACXVLQ_18640 [Bacteriovorax sp.]
MKQLLFAIFLINPCIASEIWTRNDQAFFMDRFEQTLMSKNCFNKKDRCLAFFHYKNPIKMRPATNDLRGGKNPGAVICTKYLNGEIFILRDGNNKENAFCQFKDGSLLQATSL